VTSIASIMPSVSRSEAADVVAVDAPLMATRSRMALLSDAPLAAAGENAAWIGTRLRHEYDFRAGICVSNDNVRALDGGRALLFEHRRGRRPSSVRL
jgi:hypothetical protein